MDQRIGRKGKDVVTGFEGVVTGKVDYLTGCTQLVLSPAISTDGKVEESRWFDETRVLVDTATPAVVLPGLPHDNGPGETPGRSNPLPSSR